MNADGYAVVRDLPRTKRLRLPEGLIAPGLRFQARSNGGWIVYWAPKRELVHRGYVPKTRRLWHGGTGEEPTLEEWRSIASECRRYLVETRTWERANPNLEYEPEPPLSSALADYGQAPPPRPIDFGQITLAIEEWLARDLPSPDRLLGEWLTTTSRVLLNAPTGLGKTNLALALCAHIAAGVDFMHWRAHRMARVLFIDGEMSRRLLKRRAQDMVRRLGKNPAGLYLLSHEDVPNFQPLNTPGGQAFLAQLIERLGGLDLIGFDNVMSLIAGDQKDEEGWQRASPLVNSLTGQGIGQLWINHTGHDTTRGYGTKTREWKMDTVLHLTEEKRGDTDVSFRLEFHKARERTPETRRDFQDVTIALVEDQWTCGATARRRGKPSPLGIKFLEALHDAFAGGQSTTFQGWKAIKEDLWKAECIRRGLVDPEASPIAPARCSTNTSES
jgi:hypothetical protein